MNARPPTKNLALTLAYGYDWEQLRVFVVSLVKSGFQGDLVIFGAKLSRATIQMLKQHGVVYKPVFLPLFRLRNVFLLPGWKPYKWLFTVLPSAKLRRFLAKYVFNIMCARFAHFQHYLESHAGEYANVVVADVRDVCFQRDPFADPLPGDLVSFLETMRISESRANSKWVLQAFGPEQSHGLSDKIVSCAGVTLGKASAMLAYFNAMLAGLYKVGEMTPVAGVDQAVHNRIFHDQQIPGAVLLANGNPWCMTMGPGVEYVLDAEDHVLAGTTPIAVLHQFDRYPDLKTRVYQKYV